MTPTICKYLDCSTAHITDNDAQLLELDAKCLPALAPTLVVYQYTEGFFVFVPDLSGNKLEEHKKNCQDAGYSTHLLNLLDIARQYDCIFLRLDRDGDLYPELPQQQDW